MLGSSETYYINNAVLAERAYMQKMSVYALISNVWLWYHEAGFICFVESVKVYLKYS